MFRPLVTSDLAMVYEINEANVPAVGQESLEELENIFGLSDLSIGAFDDDRLVGFAFLLPPGTKYGSPNYRYFCDHFEDFVYLDRVAFRESHRGRGLGQALYREFEQRIAKPMITLEVNVVPPNEGSMRFHLRQGFVELEQLETRPGKVVSLMVKRLV